jgi:hypothetical protein
MIEERKRHSMLTEVVSVRAYLDAGFSILRDEI